MNADKQHIIQKVQAELTIPSEDRQREKSEELKRAVEIAIQNLEPVFNNMAGDTLCRIDSVSVEVTLPNSDFERLEEHLERELSEKLSEVLKFKSITAREAFGKGTGVEQVTPDQNFKEILAHFLKTGRLPWWAEPELLINAEHWLEELSAKDWISFLKPLREKKPGVIERFIKQFPNSVVERLIQKALLYQFDTDEILQLERELLQFMKRKKISETVIRQTRADISGKIVNGILSEIKQKKLTDDLFLFVLSKIVEFTPDQNENQKVLDSFGLWLMSSEKSQAEMWISRLESLSENISLFTDKAEREQARPLQKKRDSPEYFNKDESLTVAHGGVVLLHPFLEALFKNLGFIEDGKFLNEAAQERAVCLIHFLATGEQEFPEHELLLPKFLCGWPFDAPINRFLSLAESEKRECDSVLSSCIQHWTALKKTSIGGLRENFLRRDGILRHEEFGWSFYIEQKPQDILLEKLPWGLAIVKLKWMDEMLTVHWH